MFTICIHIIICKCLNARLGHKAVWNVLGWNPGDFGTANPLQVVR